MEMTDFMTSMHPHTHPKDCPDRKAAALDRKQHEALVTQRQERRQVLAHAEWFDWYKVVDRALPAMPRIKARKIWPST
jgi:hypothetical protein